MPRFLIEVPHESEKIACARAARALVATGSHYITNADFGCTDGEHFGWVIVEVDDKAQARGIVPPLYRDSARIVQLNRFTLEELDAFLEHHED